MRASSNGTPPAGHEKGETNEHPSHHSDPAFKSPGRGQLPGHGRPDLLAGIHPLYSRQPLLLVRGAGLLHVRLDEPAGRLHRHVGAGPHEHSHSGGHGGTGAEEGAAVPGGSRRVFVLPGNANELLLKRF